MIRLSDALEAIVSENPTLRMVLRHRLLNLSQAARFLQPLVEARAKKEVAVSAILMALSRLQRSQTESVRKADQIQFRVDNLFINSDLCVISFPSSAETRRQINSLHTLVLKEGGYFALTQGEHQITLIVDNTHVALVRKKVSEKPIALNAKVGSLGIAFKNEYADVPGFLYMIFQQFYLQNINIVEIASTANELIIYLDESAIRLGFDTLYKVFVMDPRRSRSPARA